MKKRIIPLVLVLLLALTLAVPALAAEPMYILDAAGLLTAEEWADLEQQAAAISEASDCSIYTIILDDYTEFDSDIEDSAGLLYEELDLGWGENRDGWLLLLSMDQRKYAIYTNGFGQHALTERGCEELEENMVSRFSEDQWEAGIRCWLETGGAYFAAAAAGEPYGEGSESGGWLGAFGMALIVGLLAALVVCSIFKRQMKTAAKQNTASAYVVQNGVEITGREDCYTHTVTTRTKIERDDSSSGSSSGGGVKSSSGSF